MSRIAIAIFVIVMGCENGTRFETKINDTEYDAGEEETDSACWEMHGDEKYIDYDCDGWVDEIVKEDTDDN